MLNSLVRFFLDPFNILFMLILFSAAAFYLKRQHLFRWLFAAVLGWFLLITTPLLPVNLLNSLESRYEPVFVEHLPDPTAEFHIIVLGAGHGYDDRLPANSLLNLRASGRLNEGIRLHRQLPNSRLVLSGYSSSDRTPQAEMLEMTALLLGIEQDKIITQTEPGNTFEEAQIYAANYAANHPVILVTCAFHMPRAMLRFQQVGLDPIPSPTNYRIKNPHIRRSWFPSMDNILNLRMALFEYAGLTQARAWGMERGAGAWSEGAGSK